MPAELTQEQEREYLLDQLTRCSRRLVAAEDRVQELSILLAALALRSADEVALSPEELLHTVNSVQGINIDATEGGTVRVIPIYTDTAREGQADLQAAD